VTEKYVCPMPTYYAVVRLELSNAGTLTWIFDLLNWNWHTGYSCKEKRLHRR